MEQSWTEYFTQLEEENKGLKQQLSIIKGQGGILNLERSWKSRYRNAWERANERLEDNGLPKVSAWSEQHEEGAEDNEQLTILPITLADTIDLVANRIESFIGEPVERSKVLSLIEPLVREIESIKEE